MVRLTLLTLLTGIFVSIGPPSTAAPEEKPSRPVRVAIDVEGAPRLDAKIPRKRLSPMAFKYRERVGFVVRLVSPGQSQVNVAGTNVPLSLPSPSVIDGRVIVSGGVTESRLLGLDAKTGKKLWTTGLTDNGPSAVAVTRTRAVVNTESCTTYSVDPRSGKRLWHNWIGPNVAGAPTISGKRVYAAHMRNASNGKRNQPGFGLSALDLETGKTIWTADLMADITGAPVVAEGRIYVTEKTGTLACFDGEGKTLWRAPVSAMNAPWYDAAGLFVAVRGAKGFGVLRIAPKNGAVVWKYEGGPIRNGIHTVTKEGLTLPAMSSLFGWAADPPRPVVIGSRVVAAMNRDLLVLDAFTGKALLRMTLPTGRNFSAPPAVTGKTLIFGTAEGLLLEIDPDLQAVRRVLDLKAKIPSQPVVADGMVYVMAGPCLYGIPWSKPGGPDWPQWGGTHTRSTR